jgi:hypothetical protein
MIFVVNEKKLVFGMQWKVSLSAGQVHREARAAKSQYLWHAEKSFYYGLLGSADQKQKLKGPMHSGAIAFLHKFPDVANMVLVLDGPEGGYVVCGIHQGRPRDQCDVVVETEAEVKALLEEFEGLCGDSGFKLFGDVQLPGIREVSMEDIAAAADGSTQLRKAKNALISPLAVTLGVIAVVAVGAYGFNGYSKYRKAEQQKKDLAKQKTPQQLYDEELASRRSDIALSAKSAVAMLAPLRSMSMDLGGFKLGGAVCNATPTKQVVCVFTYDRTDNNRATYAAFIASAGKTFDSIEFVGDKINATKAFKDIPFTTIGAAVDAGRDQKSEVIEFGSILQGLSNFGKHTRKEFAPFALPLGTNLAELTKPPVNVATWEFNAPLRSFTALSDFPAYATVNKIELTVTQSPRYEMAQSLAMIKLAGTNYSKSN